MAIDDPFFKFLNLKKLSDGSRHQELQEGIEIICRIRSEADTEERTKHPNLFIYKLIEISYEIMEREDDFLNSEFGKVHLSWENCPSLVMNRRTTCEKSELTSRHQLFAHKELSITVSSHKNVFPEKTVPNKYYPYLPLFLFASLTPSTDPQINKPDFEIRLTISERSRMSISFDPEYTRDLLEDEEDNLVIKLKSPKVFLLLAVYLSHFSDSDLTDVDFIKETMSGLYQKLMKKKNWEILEYKESDRLTTRGYLQIMREYFHSEKNNEKEVTMIGDKRFGPKYLRYVLDVKRESKIKESSLEQRSSSIKEKMGSIFEKTKKFLF